MGLMPRLQIYGSRIMSFQIERNSISTFLTVSYIFNVISTRCVSPLMGVGRNEDGLECTKPFIRRSLHLECNYEWDSDWGKPTGLIKHKRFARCTLESSLPPLLRLAAGKSESLVTSGHENNPPADEISMLCNFLSFWYDRHFSVSSRITKGCTLWWMGFNWTPDSIPPGLS